MVITNNLHQLHIKEDVDILLTGSSVEASNVVEFIDSKMLNAGRIKIL
jgi:hypothetical protein